VDRLRDAEGVEGPERVVSEAVHDQSRLQPRARRALQTRACSG
jgi:hypothetical protein